MLKILTGSALRSFVDHLETCETVHLSVPLVQCWIIPILSPPGRKIKLPYEVHTHCTIYVHTKYSSPSLLLKNIPFIPIQTTLHFTASLLHLLTSLRKSFDLDP